MDLTDAKSAVADLTAPVIGEAARQARIEVEQSRAACLAPDGGGDVLRCVRLCAVNGIPMPQWLGDEFARLHELVLSAEVGTWDEAFGKHWPRGTHLAKQRQRLTLIPKVHSEVWALVRSDPTKGVSRVLFDEVGERLGDVSAPVVERLYYEALSNGALNVAAWRASELAAQSQSQ